MKLPRIPWDAWRGHLHLLLWIGGTMAIVVWLIFAVPRLQAVAAQRHQSRAVEVVFADPPAWMTGDLREYLTQLVHSNIGADPFEQDDLVTVRRALLASGVFEDVEQVRRVSASRIEVQAPFILPYALVDNHEGSFLIDRNARLMHPSIQPASDHREKPNHFITIRGVFFDRPQMLGDVWPGTDIAASLALLQFIDTRPWRRQVVEIDLSLFQKKQTLLIVTDRGSEIVWGAPPGEEGVREVPAEQKLSYLDRHYRDFKHVDRGCNRLIITGDVVSCQ